MVTSKRNTPKKLSLSKLTTTSSSGQQVDSILHAFLDINVTSYFLFWIKLGKYKSTNFYEKVTLKDMDPAFTAVTNIPTLPPPSQLTIGDLIALITKRYLFHSKKKITSEEILACHKIIHGIFVLPFLLQHCIEIESTVWLPRMDPKTSLDQLSAQGGGIRDGRTILWVANEISKFTLGDLYGPLTGMHANTSNYLYQCWKELRFDRLEEKNAFSDTQLNPSLIKKMPHYSMMQFLGMPYATFVQVINEDLKTRPIIMRRPSRFDGVLLEILHLFYVG